MPLEDRMGVFGTGLYSGDFAMDLRSTVAAVSRLPYDGERLVEILISSEIAAANDPANEDHTVFWIVLADQFAKRGITSATVRDRALDIIEGNHDLSMLEKLGMSKRDLQKRENVLDELRGRLIAPPITKNRAVLRKPQSYLMEVGDVFMYPTCKRHCINPYFKSKQAQKFQQDGWAAFVIVDRGRAFDFLTWYRPLTIRKSHPERPTPEELREEPLWILRNPGTCTAMQIKKMQLEKIGSFSIDESKLRQAFPTMRPGDAYAIQDISLANSLSVDLPEYSISQPGTPVHQRYSTITDIDQILAD